MKAWAIGAVFLGANLAQMPMALSASPSPGTIIENQATGSFVNPTTSDRIKIESNRVQVRVVEVAGVALRGTGVEEAASTVNNAGPNQGNNNIDSGDIVYFTFTATNVGNDPTQFFIPGSPTSITGGTQSGNIEIIGYDVDGPSGPTAPNNFSNLPVTIPPDGSNSGDATALGLPVGAIPSGGTLSLRVPIKVNNGLGAGSPVSVTLGDTAPNDNSTNTQNQPFSASTLSNPPAGGFDFYTQDNADTDDITGEATGTPFNGDTTFHRQEASATLSTAIGPVVTDLRDYGDAPDTYGTDAIAGNSTGDPQGASHQIVDGIYLGLTAPDADLDGFVDGIDDALNATDDDASASTGNGDDEDGIVNLPRLTELDNTYTIPASNLTVTNTTGTAATLHAWIDFDNNGQFDSTEYTSAPVNTSTTQANPAADLVWSGVSGLTPGNTYIRLRLTTDPSLNAGTPGGAANDGEVEDYQLEIISGSGLVNISGTVFEDFGSGMGGNDSNNTLDPNETGINSVTVTLYQDDGDGIFEPGGGDSLVGISSQTDTDGNYSFTSLISGEYWVVVDTSDPDLDGVTYGGDNSTANGPTANPRFISLTSTSQTASFPFDQPGVAGPTFACDGTLFQALGNPAQIKFIDTVNNQLVDAPGFPSDLGGGYNSTGFNVQDGYIYGNRGGTLYRMGATGQLENLGNPANLPNSGIYVGDVDINGLYYVLHQYDDVNGNRQRDIYTIDVLGTSASNPINSSRVSGPISSNTPGIADFAFNPLNGLLYSVRGNGRVIEIDPSTGNFRDITTTGNTGNGGFGAVYFDAFGNLYAYRNNDGNLWKYAINLSTSEASGEVFATGDSVTQNDGFSCPYQVRLEKTVDSGQVNGNGIATASPGDTVTYTYRIVNANPVTVSGLNFSDIMGDGRVYIDGTIRQDGLVTTTPLGGTPNVYGGSNRLEISDISVPAGAIVNISVDVIIPSAASTGTLYNQAKITAIPPGFGGGVSVTLSDYPTTPAYGDPTPLEIVFGNRPNVLLVKRITAINGSRVNENDPGNSIQLDRYDEDDTFPYDDNVLDSGISPPDTEYWPGTTTDTASTFLIGAINGGLTKPKDEIEYTIYFLSTGDTPAENVQFCDRIPDGQAFVHHPNFSGLSTTPAPGGISGEDRGILVSYVGSNLTYTNVGGDDTAQFYPPGSGLPPACNLLHNQTEHNGAIVVNLGTLPQAMAPGTPDTSYGFIRFRAIVKQ